MAPPPARALPRQRQLRLVVVSYTAGNPLGPGGARTQELLRELRRRCGSVELVSSPTLSGSERLTRPRSRRLQGRLLRLVLIDRFERESRRRFHGWSPDVDGALLIGWPFSPLAYASSRLARLGIPYVVDIGDPWALTRRGRRRRSLGAGRARRAERAMWSSAAAAVLTTRPQRDALQALFPQLPFLVRPNGFDAAPEAPAAGFRPRNVEVLRLAHFGSTSRRGVDVGSFLSRLLAEGPWRRVELTQFGADRAGALERPGPGIDVDLRPRLPWSKIVQQAVEFDAALAIGTADPVYLPTKVVSYLSLPIPRLALTPEPERDSVGTYLRDKQGWLVLRPDAPDAAESVLRHVTRNWTPAELAPPPSESWEAVAREIADFVLDALGSRP